MSETLSFLLRYGYVLVFAAVLIDQLGLPMPAEPLLLAAGALARDGRQNLGLALALAVLGSMIGHTVWYEAGRRAGARILRFICEISLEPDVCVRRGENLFARRGAKSLVIAHFIPGLDLVAQPLAAISGMKRPAFFAFSFVAALLWSVTYVGVGYIFGHQLEAVAQVALRLGFWLVAILGGAFAAYLAWKILQRQRVLWNLRVARIAPEELKKRLDAGETIAIVDLRHPIEFESDPRTIPTALRMAAEELELRHQEIPRDREVVLYCT